MIHCGQSVIVSCPLLNRAYTYTHKQLQIAHAIIDIKKLRSNAVASCFSLHRKKNK